MTNKITDDVRTNATTMDLKPVYSLIELLQLVPVSKTSIYKEIREGRLISSKIGRRTIFFKNDIQTWLNKIRISA